MTVKLPAIVVFNEPRQEISRQSNIVHVNVNPFDESPRLKVF